MTSTKYELIRLDTFTDNLGSFNRNTIEKINGKVENMLQNNPYRYGMLLSKIKVKGAKLSGLRHMKIGVKGIKGGAYVLYRVCEECKKNKYYEESGVKCQFCDDIENNRVVLFDVNLRSFGYRQ